MKGTLVAAAATLAILTGCNAQAIGPGTRTGQTVENVASLAGRSQVDGKHRPRSGGVPPVFATATYGRAYGIRPSYEACIRNQPDDLSTAGHRQDCADAELAFQEARLETVYQANLRALRTQGASGQAQAVELEQAQGVWLAQVDEECAREAEQAGSAMGPAAQSTCYMDRTASRARQLEVSQSSKAN